MSDIWSFYGFQQMMNEAIDFGSVLGNDDKQEKKPQSPLQPNTAGETEKPAEPQQPLQKLQRPKIGGADPLQQAVGNASLASGKGRAKLREKMKTMEDGEAKQALRDALSKDTSEAVMTLNDINGAWPTGYWATINKLEELGYDVPELPPIQKPASGRWEDAENWDNAPRWVGYERGDWKKVKNPDNPKEEIIQSNGGAKDGPYVKINSTGPYSVRVTDEDHLQELLRAAYHATNDPNERKAAAERHKRIMDRKGSDLFPPAVGKGDFDAMDMQAGREGQAGERLNRMRGKIKAKKLGGKPTMDAMQGRSSILGKAARADREDLLGWDKKTEKPKPPEMKSGPSEELAQRVADELQQKLAVLDQIAGVSGGEDGESWDSEVSKIQAWAADILKNKAAALKGTDIWDELQQIVGDMGANEWSEMNEWVHYTDILENMWS